MVKDSGEELRKLRVDGGACKNNYLMQTQSDISNIRVERPATVETTALGAAYLAGLAVGFWSGIDDIRQNELIDRSFSPNIDEESRKTRIDGWHRAVAKTGL